MTEVKVKYKNADKWVYGEVKEIKLIGEDDQLEKGMYYFVFWINHNNQHLSTHVSHKELFEWFRIDQAELDRKLMKESAVENII
jgi:hypothetical protein